MTRIFALMLSIGPLAWRCEYRCVVLNVNTATREELITEIARLTRENQRLSEANSNAGWELENRREAYYHEQGRESW